jgi:uncharacterized protein
MVVALPPHVPQQWLHQLLAAHTMPFQSTSSPEASATRRNFLCCGTLLFAGLWGFSAPSSGLSFKDGLVNPCEPQRAWSAAEQALIDASFAGLNAADILDIHAHLLGTGDSGSGCHVNDALYSLWRPIDVLRRKNILGAGCVDERAGNVDVQYLATLTRLMADFPTGAKAALLAFDCAHDERGQRDLAQSTFYVPNAYAAASQAAQRERFEWVASVHPYRDDAVEQIAAAQANGAIALKWLPSAMNINWRDARLVPVYDYLARNRLPLIAHFGEEKAVPGAGRDEFLNPLLARVPLDRGVRLIMAHCASLGHAPDLDRTSKASAPCFDLFARLMSERSYEKLLLADTSAVFQDNRSAPVWRRVVAESAWQPRLVHGSDYPLPGVWPLYNLEALAAANVLDPQKLPVLQSIRRRNVLLFDFVLKRQLRFGATTLANSVFMARKSLA